MNGEFEQINPLIGYLEEPEEMTGTLDGPLTRGYSAYEIYLEHGGTMTEEEWLASLKGDPGYTPQKGIDYDDGENGFSPNVEVEPIENGHRVTITDATGDHTFDVEDGLKGDPGDPGYTPQKGTDYDDGQDGVSPVVTVQDITGGHRITITDAQGPHVYDVMDGAKGDPGSPGSPGYTPQKGTDYWTASDKAEMESDILQSQTIADMQDEITSLNGDLNEKADKVSNATNGNFAGLDSNGNLTDSGKKASDFLTQAPVTDVQVFGSSILNNGIANIPKATGASLGVVKAYGDAGLVLSASDPGLLLIQKATSEKIKAGTGSYNAIVPGNQHESTFYGLAKAAGDSTQSASSNAVGTYTDAAKVAIQRMLGLGEWFKLWDDTTTEEVVAYSITTDSNGNPFVLSNAIIQIIAPASTSQTVYLSVYNTNDLRTQVNLGNIIGTGVMRTIVRFELIADSWNIMMNTPTNNYRDIDKTNMRMYCGLLKPAEPINIAKIKLDATAIPIGTQFIVYGKQS